MRRIGLIYKVDLNRKLIAIKGFQRIYYYYFQTSQVSIFKRYLIEGVYFDVEYNEDKKLIKQGIEVYPIDFVYRIYYLSIYKRITYYDYQEINSSLSKFLSSLGNMMFLDLEMTMPPYGFTGKEYPAEIIQAGYLLVDATGEEISRYTNYIKPVFHPSLSTRTMRFLNLDAANFYNTSITYKEFYAEMKEIIETYHPTIIIFGKNDRLALQQSFVLNHVPSLDPMCRFVNICKLIKNYYHLKQDPGLFKLYQIYYENDALQVHDAFNDSYVTKEVFQAFRNDIAHKTDFYPKIRRILK